MEQSPNFWMQTFVQVAGADVTVLEAVLLAAIVGVVWYLMRRQAERQTSAAHAQDEAQRTLEALKESQAALDARLAGLAEGAVASSEGLRRSLDSRLEEVTRRLGDGLSENQRRTGDSLQKLNERLALIDRAQENIKALTGEVTGLQALLSNKQRRGAFGEMQMRDLVDNFLPQSAREFQATLSNGKRVDCLITLPAPPGNVAVDAKFPLEAWRAFSETDEPAARETAARALRADVLRHIKDISEKYLIPHETADTALMFVPSEAVYATLHSEFADVVEKSFRARVMIVSPTTFMATLHTMRAVMRDARMREQAHIIQKEVTLLADDVGRLDERVAKLQKHFDQSTDDIRQIRISTDKVVKRAERIEEAPLEEDEPAKIAPDIVKPLPAGE